MGATHPTPCLCLLACQWCSLPLAAQSLELYGNFQPVGVIIDAAADPDEDAAASSTFEILSPNFRIDLFFSPAFENYRV